MISDSSLDVASAGFLGAAFKFFSDKGRLSFLLAFSSFLSGIEFYLITIAAALYQSKVINRARLCIVNIISFYDGSHFVRSMTIIGND